MEDDIKVVKYYIDRWETTDVSRYTVGGNVVAAVIHLLDLFKHLQASSSFFRMKIIEEHREDTIRSVSTLLHRFFVNHVYGSVRLFSSKCPCLSQLIELTSSETRLEDRTTTSKDL